MRKSERIPSLDGWRALSIILVLVGHELVDGTFVSRFNIGKDTLYFLIWPTYGVQIFFIISGFIITKLLLNEEQVSHSINLTGFYKRRFFRIIPPLAAYLLVVFILSRFFHNETISPLNWFAAIFFLANVTSLGFIWSTGHLWSLSVEEQFYLFWPFIFGHKKWRVIFPWIFVIVAPICRIIEYKRPGTFGEYSLFTRADSIFAGALFAIYLPRFEKGFKFRLVEYLILMLAPLSAVCQKLGAPHTGLITIPFNSTLFSMAVIILIRWSMDSGSVLYGILNYPIVTWLGRISYSLYLWQQLFYPVSILGKSPFTLFPTNMICTFVLATMSYYIIENPIRKWQIRVKAHRKF